MSTFELDMQGVPQAARVAVFFCEGAKCLRPHVALLNNEGLPFAQFVLPDPHPDGSGFLKDLKDAAYRSAVERTKI